jgi:hypothetical protein
MSHTPGPWDFIPSEDPKNANANVARHWVRGPETDESKCRTICDIAKWDTQERQAANARLIAAAPEMLEALEVTAENIRSLGPAGALSKVYAPYEEWLKVVEAAIAKAKGEI